MAELALAAAASAIGGSISAGVVAFGMTGAQIGWMVGSLAGSLLFAPKGPDGPRLEDKSVQVSTYGQPIPRVYGTQRLAGNVLWSTELIETAKEEGGKGGPSYTTYSYRASFAVGVCRGPIVGIRRIWADGKIIFDQSETNTGPQKGYDAQSLAIYTGTESQLPDPTIQALIGDTPAYRGQAYIVFTDLQLEKFGNRLPSLTFEVVTSGVYTQPPPLAIGNGNADGDFDPESGYFWTHNSSKTVYVHDVYAGEQIASIQAIPASSTLGLARTIAYFPEGFWQQSTAGGLSTGLLPRSFHVGIGKTDLFGGANQGCAYVSADAQTYLRRGYITASALIDLDGVYRNPITGDVYIYQASSAIPTEIYVCGLFGPNGSPSLATPIAPIGGTNDLYQYIFTLGDTDHAAAIRIGSYGVGLDIINLHSNTLVWTTRTTVFLPNQQQGGAFDTRRRNILQTRATVDTTALLTSFDTRATQAITTVSLLGDPVYHAGLDAWLVARQDTVVVLHPETLAVQRTINTPGYTLKRLFLAQDSDEFILATTTANVLLKIFVSPRLASLPVPLSDVVAAESALVGLSASDIDVSALTTTLVAGFAVAGGGAVRSNIEQLMMAYAFDAVESGGVVKFVKRGGPVVATIDDAELAAHQPGQSVPAPLPITRAEEVELPQRITVRYSNPQADYQIGAQSAQRLTGRALGQQSTDLPLVLTDDQARQIAESALYSAWASRLTTTFTTTLKHAALEPTDVVQAAGNTLRITRRMENAGLLTFEATFENGNVFTQSALGAPASTPAQTISTLTRTDLALLDIPPLRDQDDDAGFYLAGCGYASGWDGALVYKSTDGGSSYAELLALTSAATMGSATTALAAWAGQNEFDEINAVNIRLRGGTLSSLSELAVLNGGNAALLGGEILQFKAATLEADGTYTLRGLLRGRKATPTGGHLVGDVFVLLTSAALRRTPALANEIGLERLYKAVTFGSTLSGASSRAFTNTGASLKPLAPAQLGGGRSASGDVSIQWRRRTRIGGAWRDYADAPLAEASEAYAVEVYADSTFATLKRTLSATTRSVTYTSAQQITDFGSTQAVVHVRVYQTSAAVGRGGALQGSV